MKFRFPILIFVTLLLVVSAVNAYSVNYFFKDQNNNKVSDVDALVYTCQDASCSSVLGPRIEANSNDYSPNDDLQITYPSEKESQYGYALYFYKEGYIPKEYFIDAWGTGSTDVNIQLNKVELCSAPIDHIEVLNDVRPNIPLVIDVSASLDADTYSAFHSNSNTPAYTPEGYEDFYSAETKVTLLISKDLNTSSYEYREEKILNLFMDSSQPVQFTWTPTEQDDYFVLITTEVIDNQCSSSKQQTATASFMVHEDVPSNACYTLINRPGTSNPIDAEVDENIVITGDKSSYYIDNYQNIEPVDSQVTLKIYKGTQIVYTQTKDTFEFNWVPTQPGDYRIEVSGIATDAKCTGLENYPSQVLTIPLTVYPKSDIPEEPILELKFLPNQVVDEGSELTFFVMPNIYTGQETIQYNAENLPEGAVFEPIYGSGVLNYPAPLLGYKFTWTPDYETVKHETTIFDTIKDVITKFFNNDKECRDDGKCDFKVTFKVSGGNLNDQQEVTISVRDVNQWPHVLNPIGPIIVTEGDLVKIVPTEGFTDLDFDELTYSYTSPLDQNGEWQTGIGDAGKYISTITASDGQATATQDILIVVSEAEVIPGENHAPVFNEIDDITVEVGEKVKFTIGATDEDNDELTYRIIVIPTSANFDSETNEFSWTPTQTGKYQAWFEVKDTEEAKDVLIVNIKVTESGKILDLKEIPSKSIMLGQSVSFTLETEYTGENELIFSVVNLPEGAVFENEAFSWTPTQTGNFNINFKVTDGILEDQEAAVITVTEEPSAIRATKHDIGIQRIIVNYMDKVETGEYFPITVYAKNLAGRTESDVRITVSLPELSEMQYSQGFKLKPKETKVENFMFQLPVNTDKKDYVAIVTVSNNKDKDVKYVSITLE